MNHLSTAMNASRGMVVFVSASLLNATQTTNVNEYPQEDELLMPDWGFTLTAIILFFIGFFGFFFNLIVIVLMYKDIQLWTPINIILLNLVCSDFSVSIFGNPFTFTAAIYKEWIFGESWCIFYGFFMSLLGITSITTLTVLAYERYCLVCRPLSSRHNRNSYLSILSIWTYSLAVTTPPLMDVLVPGAFSWGKYVLEPPNISCSVNWSSHEANATSYIIYMFVLGLIVPLVVITYSYCNILRTMKKNALQMGQVNKVESKVTMMIGVMIVLFMVAWTPYSMFALMEQFGSGVSPSLAVLPALLAKSSIIYNPIIYVGMNTQYRAAWNRFWTASGEGGLKSGLDTTVDRISSKFSIELELLKRRQMKAAGKNNRNDNNLTAVEEVSQAESPSNHQENLIKDVVVQQKEQSNGNVTNTCTAVMLPLNASRGSEMDEDEEEKPETTKSKQREEVSPISQV